MVQFFVLIIHENLELKQKTANLKWDLNGILNGIKMVFRNEQTKLDLKNMEIELKI